VNIGARGDDGVPCGTPRLDDKEWGVAGIERLYVARQALLLLHATCRAAAYHPTLIISMSWMRNPTSGDGTLSRISRTFFPGWAIFLSDASPGRRPPWLTGYFPRFGGGLVDSVLRSVVNQCVETQRLNRYFQTAEGSGMAPAPIGTAGQGTVRRPRGLTPAKL
jgi:hypothetical protein